MTAAAIDRRYVDWQVRLGNYFSSVRDREFKWGEFDCCIFACDAVREQTGLDLAAEFRGIYFSYGSAVKMMRRFCGGGVEQVAEKVTAQFNIPEVPRLCARRGDVMLLDTERGPALGIVGLDGWMVFGASFKGLSRTPLVLCRRAWRIG
jgi:hypothetical protein